MKMLVLIASVIATGSARADELDATADRQVVLVNAASDPKSLGTIGRLRRVLDSRKLLVKLDEDLEATLDGRAAALTDVEAIKEAYATSDFDAARMLIEKNERRILDEPAAGEPARALAALAVWRGLIAVAEDQPDEAVRWFRAAHRLDPGWQLDAPLASPRVRSFVKRAKREPAETGTLRVTADPNAKITIDAGEQRNVDERIALPVGMHLVTISAPKRKPRVELVDIEADRTVRLDVSLDDESTRDRAARLVDATAAAPAGSSRLKPAGALGKLTGSSRILVVEDGQPNRLTVRVYDVRANQVSQALELDANAPSSAIARDIATALDAASIADQAPSGAPAKKWYARWYVWAAVGAVAAVGGYAAYEVTSREPTMLRGL